MHIVNCPIRLPHGTKKKPDRTWALNLNIYRNTHERILHAMKVKFDELMQPLLQGLPRMDQVELTFTLFTDTRRVCDTANVCCIVDKFFSDSLVHAGKIEDDNYNVVLKSTYLYGGIDKDNPRVAVTIEPVGSNSSEESTDNMRIMIIQSEIEEAIAEKVLSQMSINDDMELQIELSATRGPDGMTATIDVVPRVEKASPIRKRKAATGSASTAKEEVKPQAEPEVEEAQAEQDTAEEAADAPAEEAAEAEPVTERKTGSIFGNLKKPVNEKTDA